MTNFLGLHDEFSVPMPGTEGAGTEDVRRGADSGPREASFGLGTEAHLRASRHGDRGTSRPGGVCLGKTKGSLGRPHEVPPWDFLDSLPSLPPSTLELPLPGLNSLFRDSLSPLDLPLPGLLPLPRDSLPPLELLRDSLLSLRDF